MRRFFAILCLGLLAGTACRAAELCPATLTTEQQALNVPKDYQAYHDPGHEDPAAPNELYDVWLSTGNPQSFDWLRPDGANNKMEFWNIAYFQKASDVWVLCRYTNTELTLAKKLPRNLTRCTVHFVDAKHVFMQGEPVISSSECQ